MEEEFKRYAVVTGDGNLICITGSDTVEPMPIEKVCADNIFTHFRCDLEDFKNFVDSLDRFDLKRNPFHDINLDECSFMEVKVNDETGEVILC